MQQKKVPRRFLYWAGGALLAASALARALSYPVITSDYTYFIRVWFVALQTHAGLSAFASPFSDYAPAYLYILKLLTYLPVPSLYSVKTVSVLFDLVIAATAYVMLQRTAPIRYDRAQLFFAFAVMCSIPTLVLNSSLWGQSDSIYAAGIVLSLYYLLTDRPFPAVAAFSLALCVKVQAIFFLPVLVGYCLRKESSAGYLILIPLVYFFSVVPARLGGGSLSDLLLVYARESSEYTSLSVSAQNVFVLFGNTQFLGLSQGVLFWAGIVCALLVSAAIAALVYVHKTLSPRALVALSFLCVLLLAYVLPRMHERYFYLADVLSVIYTFYDSKRWYLAALVVTASLLSYMPYLSQVSWFSGMHVDLRLPSLMLLAVLPLLCWRCYKIGVIAERVVS